MGVNPFVISERLLLGVLLILATPQASLQEPCEYGRMPGTASFTNGSYNWEPYEARCKVHHLLPYFAAPYESSDDMVPWKAKAAQGVSMLMIGDSVDRFMLWDLNSTAISSNWTAHQSLLKEHWRGALRLPNLEMVYQFAPGSHEIGPYHDDLAYDMSIVNAIPRGFELHRLLTGRSSPNVVVFSNILWDLGRWLFLSELADTNETPCFLIFHRLSFGTDYYGLPLLGDSEFIPVELLEEWRRDTHVQMQRIEKYVGADAMLIYHNSAFPKLKDLYNNGTLHEQKGTGRRTHIVQLNALARQIVKERPRWHLVDYGLMSEAFIGGSYLRDPHHPNLQFTMKALDIYLNLHAEYGRPLPPKEHVIGDLDHWDSEYELNGKGHRDAYWQSNQEETARWLEEEARRKNMTERPVTRRASLKENAVKHSYRMMLKLHG